MPEAGAVRRVVLTLGLAGVLAAPGGWVWAAHGPDATVLTVQAAYLRRAIERGERVTLIDLRPEAEHRVARLPGARSIPLPEIRARHAEVPTVGLVVLYGPGPAGPLREGYLFLRSLGYRNLAVLEDGYTGWVARGFPLERP